MSLTTIAIAIAAGLAAIIGAYFKGTSTGAAKQRVKEAIAREQDIQNIKKAADAGARVRPDDGGMLDDPYNRDRRQKP